MSMTTSHSLGALAIGRDSSTRGSHAGLLEAIRAARAKALAKAWDAGARPEELILDIDASLLIAHSEKEGAAGDYKGGFGFHPLLCYLDETGEPLAGLLRPGNAGANTAADHFEVLQMALEQELPEADLGREILVRTDIGGRTHAFTQDCRDAGIRFSVGFDLDRPVREAIAPHSRSALDGLRTQGQDEAPGRAERRGRREATDLIDLSGWPEGSRLIVRRERPHPGAQLSFTDYKTGHRFKAFITDQGGDRLAAFEVRHRRRARVEDAIGVDKETGMRRMPFPAFAQNKPGWSCLGGAGPARWTRCCWVGSSRSPSPSGCATASFTLPGALAPGVAPSCACRRAGPGRRSWRRPSRS